MSRMGEPAIRRDAEANFRLDLAFGGLNFQLDAPGRDGFRYRFSVFASQSAS
jgi:hypothetical protein